MADSTYSTEFVDLFTEDLEAIAAYDDEMSIDFDTLEIVTDESLSSDADINTDWLFDFFSVGIVADELTSIDLNTGESTGNLGSYYSGGDTIWGTPYSDSLYWREQQTPTTCAIVAQVGIYESITGKYISEYSAANYAQSKGWFDPATGTAPEDCDNILNVLGITTEQYEGPYIDIVDIATAMNNGDKVIAAVDGNEIWNPVYDPITGEPLEQTLAGHAVWVTGIELHADDTIDIILNDSGTPYGQMEVVDYFDFVNAWEDYDNFLIVVDA
jgi:hypothetical protein